jgi:hypothetical protein
MYCILVPWCKCHVSIHIFLMSNSNTKQTFFMLPFYCVPLAMFGVIYKAIQLVCSTFFSSIGTHWNNNCDEQKKESIQSIFVVLFIP